MLSASLAESPVAEVESEPHEGAEPSGRGVRGEPSRGAGAMLLAGSCAARHTRELRQVCRVRCGSAPRGGHYAFPVDFRPARPRPDDAGGSAHEAVAARSRTDRGCSPWSSDISAAPGCAVSRLALGTMTWGRDTDEDDAADAAQGFSRPAARCSTPPTSTATATPSTVIGALLGQPGAARRAGDRHQGGQRPGRRPALRRLARPACCARWTPRCAGSAPTTSTCGRCTATTRRPRSRRRWRALDLAVSAGRARYVGVSNFSRLADRPGRHLAARVVRAGAAGGHPDGVLAARSAASSARCCRPRWTLGLGLLAWSPLGRGRADRQVPPRPPAGLAGRLAVPGAVRPAVPGPSARRRIVDAVVTAADGLGAARWRWRSPGCATGPAWRARSSAPGPPLSCGASLSVEELTLPDEIRGALDDISAPVRRYPDQDWNEL